MNLCGQNFFPAASFPKVNGKQSMTMTILDTPLRIVRSPISYSKGNFLHFHPEGGREGGRESSRLGIPAARTGPHKAPTR